MSNEESKDYYKQKGMTRLTVILGETGHARLRDLAKEEGLSQGDIIEVLLFNSAIVADQGFFEAKRQSKIAGRTEKTSLAKKLKNLTPEQRAQIEAIVGK